MSKLPRRLLRAWNVLPSHSLNLALYCRSHLRRRAPCLFVSAFPKSGSTFLVTALVHTSGFPRYYLGQDFRSEQDFYFPRLVDAWAMPVVSHQHARATEPNLEYLHRFQIRPVILTRHLADCLVSLRDHLCKESLVTPTFNAHRDFRAWPEARQYDALVDLAAGWYLDFYSGWCRAQAQGLDLLRLNYETLIADPERCLQQVMEFHRLEVSHARLLKAVKTTQARGNTTRKNVGISGRGLQTLSADQLARLDALCQHFPDTDFSPIGAPFNGRPVDGHKSSVKAG